MRCSLGFVLCSLFVLNGCSELQSLPGGPIQRDESRFTVSANATSAPLFGVSLSGSVHGGASQAATPYYCAASTGRACSQDGGDITYGKRWRKISQSQSGGNSSGSAGSATQTAKSKLGYDEFSQQNLAVGYTAYGASNALFAWSDLLFVTSKTLPAGSPVQLQVSLSFSGSVYGCNQYSNASVSFNGSGGLTLSGYCTYSGFVVLAGGQPGNTDTAVLSTVVGSALAIAGSGEAESSACCTIYQAQLDIDGSVTWSVKSLTPHASYATASGHRYDPPKT